ncbi:unnamed protein product [Litomosoides sigmodontis]|uniref:Uncharacterized protein n=1 Tax=Litomosoides sigmodontis TaxID=42156 RepID=A0A3P6V1A4_LITSI|nr:unnamed protein product [Litomosoides sigmodontis]
MNSPGEELDIFHLWDFLQEREPKMLSVLLEYMDEAVANRLGGAQWTAPHDDEEEKPEEPVAPVDEMNSDAEPEMTSRKLVLREDNNSYDSGPQQTDNIDQR